MDCAGERTMTTLAGVKLRRWRKRQVPPLSGQDAAELLGISPANLYRMEAQGRVPMHETAHAMVQRGICAHEDFHSRVALIDEREDAVALCERCEARPGSPEAQCCTRADCPRRVKAAA